MFEVDYKTYRRKLVIDLIIFVLIPISLTLKGYPYILILTLFGIVKFWIEKNHWNYLKEAVNFPLIEARVSAITLHEVQNIYACVVEVEGRRFKIRGYKFEIPVTEGDVITLLFDDKFPERSLIPSKEKFLKISGSTLKHD